MTPNYLVFLFQITNFTSMIANNNWDSNMKVCILSQFNKYGVSILNLKILLLLVSFVK
jgi:hypothetical protein